MDEDRLRLFHISIVFLLQTPKKFRVIILWPLHWYGGVLCTGSCDRRKEQDNDLCTVDGEHQKGS